MPKRCVHLCVGGVPVPGSLTQGDGFVLMPYGGPDDVTAVDAVQMAQRLGLVEPLPAQVLQQAPVFHRPSEAPRHRDGSTEQYL